jgi:hypothetical protein
VFINSSDEIIETATEAFVKDSEHDIPDNIVRIKAQCPEDKDVGYIAQGGWRCYVTARTNSGFVYKTATFNLNMIEGQEQVMPQNVGDTKVTKAQM